MKRLIVLIGIRQPGGGLSALKSIKKCVEDMRDWALKSQKIPRGDIKIFTDIPELKEQGDSPNLSVSDIYTWIDTRSQEPVPADQLLIYFSGHGMQSGGATLWLLPQAPQKNWEAVNLDTSIALAIWSRFKHVVFIGDCCASVADNAQFDEVKGASILQNTPDEARIKQQPVDFLRAARPGKVSLEVIINGVSLSPYTVQLVEALGGSPATILESQTPGAAAPMVLRVRKLADQLQTSVNSFLRANSITPPGPPFANVVSTTQWIALFPTPPLPPQPPSTVPPPPVQAPLAPGAISFVLTPAATAAAFPQGVSGGQSGQATNELKLGLDEGLRRIAGGSLVAVSGTDWSSNIPDGYHYETQCGFFITGAAVQSAESRPGVDCTVYSRHEIKIDPKAMELVLIEFQGGGGIMIPAIPGQIGFIHLEEGRLASLAYEPSGHAALDRKSLLRREFETKSQRIRNLRDTLLNVVTGGELSFTDIDPKTVLDVINEIPFGGKVDFSTLLYLAYLSYASRLATRAILPLAEYMQTQFGFVPFDLKILLSLVQIVPRRFMEFAPPFPLLTQGWSLLKATHEQLPPELADLDKHYRNTAWTHLDSSGLELCRSYLSRKRTGGTSSQSGNIPIVVTEPAVEVDFEQPGLSLRNFAEFAIESQLQQTSGDRDEEQGLTISEQ